MKLKESVKNVLGVVLFYGIIVLGVVLLNARLGEMQNKSAVAETTTQYTR